MCKHLINPGHAIGFLWFSEHYLKERIKTINYYNFSTTEWDNHIVHEPFVHSLGLVDEETQS